MCIRRSGAWREWTTGAGDGVHKSLHGPQGKRGQMCSVLTAVDFTDESLISSYILELSTIDNSTNVE